MDTFIHTQHITTNINISWGASRWRPHPIKTRGRCYPSRHWYTPHVHVPWWPRHWHLIMFYKRGLVVTWGHLLINSCDNRRLSIYSQPISRSIMGVSTTLFTTTSRFRLGTYGTYFSAHFDSKTSIYISVCTSFAKLPVIAKMFSIWIKPFIRRFPGIFESEGICINIYQTQWHILLISHRQLCLLLYPALIHAVSVNTLSSFVPIKYTACVICL